MADTFDRLKTVLAEPYRIEHHPGDNMTTVCLAEGPMVRDGKTSSATVTRPIPTLVGHSFSRDQ